MPANRRQLCHLPATQTASFMACLGFFSSALPCGEDKGSQSRGTRCEGKSTACTKQVQDFSSAASPVQVWEPQPSLPACLSALHPQRAPPFRPAGFPFNNAQSCLLPNLHPPPPPPPAGPTGPASLSSPSGPRTAVPPMPHPFVPEHIRERRAGDCLHPRRTNKAWMPTSETRE